MKRLAGRPAEGAHPWLMRRPVLPSRMATGLVAVLFAFGCNLAFWTATVREFGGVLARPLFLCAILAVLLSTFTLLAALVQVRGVFKPVVAVVFAASVIVDHFALSSGIRLDAAMVQNTVETDPGEVLELITPTLLLHAAFLGLLPVVLLLRSKIRYGRPLAELRGGLVLALGSMAVLVAVGLGFYKDFAGLAREHRELVALVTPFNYVVALRNYLRGRSTGGAVLVAVGSDARSVRPTDRGLKPKLVVLVVGETARAASFSLNGYARPTNPGLTGKGVISFTSVKACGTSTATSLPCMFSDLGRAEFDSNTAKHRENLLDVLSHAGIDVIWRENNTGCKHVCDRVRTEDRTRAGIPGLCTDDACFDEVLLEGLEELIDRAGKDTLIVLHQEGSHGPAYYRRYPASFRRFLPECTTNDLNRCSRESIVNAYDNTILYTDHVLARLIEILGRYGSQRDTAMLYVSDHGESLGEHHLYLHGMPFAFAPDVQTRVPMVAWFSPGLIASDGIDTKRLAADRDTPLSHDNLFHSILGLLEVDTREYRRDLDAFAPYRERNVRDSLPGTGQP